MEQRFNNFVERGYNGFHIDYRFQNTDCPCLYGFKNQNRAGEMLVRNLTKQEIEFLLGTGKVDNFRNM